MPTHLALITIIDPGLSVGYPLPPAPPLGTWGGVAPPYPAHPIAPGGPPPSIWPSPGVPTHPIYLPPGIWGGGNQPFPTPPIAPGGPPLGTWGGVAPPYPAHPIAPGGPPPGIWGGGNVPMPNPPIYLPPGTIPGVPEHPIYIPPGSGVPGVPTHPIVIPPEPEKPQVLENWDVKTYWSPATGWGVAVVPSETHPGTPTPSR